MVRPPRRVAWLACLLLAAIACSPFEGGNHTTPVATPPRARDVRLARLADGTWRTEAAERLPLARVLRVVDGDTFLVEGDDGRPVRVRVFGIRAPEPTERCGPEATTDVERAVGGQVRLLEDERSEDRFRRQLRYVFTADGVLVDAELIRMGSAEAWRDDGGYRDILVALEAAARLEGRGCLWGR